MCTPADSNEYWWFRKVSEHGLGHLLNPVPEADSKRWMQQGWAWTMGRADPPHWFIYPAVSQITVSTPHVLKAFDGYNSSKPIEQQVRPFNFCLSAHVAPLGHPEGVDPLRFHLIAPYSNDGRRYLDLEWTDQFSGDRFEVTTTDDFGRAASVLLLTYGDVFARYGRHPEAKSLDATGAPARGDGWLARRPLREGSRSYIGKESNRLEEVEARMWHRQIDVLQHYGDALEPWDSWVVPILQQIPVRLLMERSDLDRRTLQRARNQHSWPHTGNEQILIQIAGVWAQEQLQKRGIDAPRSNVLACRAWLEVVR